MTSKYVNMADIMRSMRQSVSESKSCVQECNHKILDGTRLTELLEFAELFFFAYRDFISDPDIILSEFGFGRAHHRVLHFVNRHPGLRVADLLKILNITKQSLARVLRQLVDTGYVLQKAGKSDKRERLLFPTEKGRQLAASLMEPQLNRISQAIENMDKNTRDEIRKFLYTMISRDERMHVSELLNAPVSDLVQQERKNE